MPRRLVKIPLRWSDMDAYGHVNNVLYLRLLEQARVEVFSYRKGADALGEDSHMVVGRQEIDYRYPLHYTQEPVSVDVWCAGRSRSTFDLQYEVFDLVDGERRVYAQAETTMVLVSQSDHKARPMSDSEAAFLDDMSDERMVLLAQRRREKAAG